MDEGMSWGGEIAKTKGKTEWGFTQTAILKGGIQWASDERGAFANARGRKTRARGAKGRVHGQNLRGMQWKQGLNGQTGGDGGGVNTDEGNGLLNKSYPFGDESHFPRDDVRATR